MENSPGRSGIGAGIEGIASQQVLREHKPVATSGHGERCPSIGTKATECLPRCATICRAPERGGSRRRNAHIRPGANVREDQSRYVRADSVHSHLTAVWWGDVHPSWWRRVGRGHPEPRAASQSETEYCGDQWPAMEPTLLPRATSEYRTHISTFHSASKRAASANPRLRRDCDGMSLRPWIDGAMDWKVPSH